MTKVEQLSQAQQQWRTDIGAWFAGERVVFRGKDLLTELHHLSWMGLLLYGITGKIPTEKQQRLFERLWVLSTSYPELRLWNNRVVALAGTVRSTAALGISAGVAVSQAEIYGGCPMTKAIDFLYRIKPDYDQGKDLTELVNLEIQQHKIIAGYGRPLIRTDERIQAVMQFAQELALDQGEYVKLAFAIEQVLFKLKHHKIYMNVAGLLAALAADQGMSVQDYNLYITLCFAAGMFPCFKDTVSQPEATFFPFSCEQIEYTGKAKRQWSQ